ncbi:hypothetical protein ABPG77_009730 [Micractinium sp. CCAP 211/92]
MASSSPRRTSRRWLAVVLLLATCAARATAALVDPPTCTPGKKLDDRQKLVARYIFELSNNRQTKCSPFDFVQDPKKVGFKVDQLCTQPGQRPSDKYVNLTATFRDCNGKVDKLQARTLFRKCKRQDPLLQPWEDDNLVIKVQDMPKGYRCPPDMSPIPVEKDVDKDFTPQWEFTHMAENGMKYKLYRRDPSVLPACTSGGAYVSTTMKRGCYDADSGRYEGYATVEFDCGSGKPKAVSLFAKGTLLGREACPWPMFLPGSDGYDPAFDFTKVVPAELIRMPKPSPTAGEARLSKCLDAAGIINVDGANPAALRKAAQVWNRLNSTVPAAVAYPADANQVAAAVKCAKAAGIKPVARSGGHSYMGYSVMPGQLTISLNLLNATKLSKDGKTAVVQAGSRLGQLYFNVADQSNGMKAAVGGTCPPVGTGGLFTGGGIGFLTRQYGLACDQFVALKMVNAKGSIITADSKQNSDLLAAWCGGGGGNFGLIVEFTVKVHDVPAKLTLVKFKIVKRQALEWLRFMQTGWVLHADPRLSVSVNIDSDGVEATGQWTGTKQELQAELAATGVTAAKWQFVNPPKYYEKSWIDSVVFNADTAGVNKPNQLLDISAMELDRPYFKLKSFFATKPLPDAALQAMIDWVPKIDPLGGYIEIDLLGPKSAVAKVAANATGFGHRDALFSIQYGAEWQSKSVTSKALPLIESLQQQLNPYFDPQQRPAYVNYIDIQIGPKPQTSYYGRNAGWLSQVKAKYDPEGLFSSNPLSIPIDKKAGRR